MNTLSQYLGDNQVTKTLNRITYLMAAIAEEEGWLEYYRSKHQDAPETEKRINELRAELRALRGDQS
jgi:hypothetical protein